LSGEIPTGLTQMASLTKLLLSNNQLSGIIPEYNPQRLTFDANGNKDLINATTSKTSSKSATKGISVTAASVIGLAVGIALA
jgi:hypothetical protein